jgi:cellulose biosynthesis protein BcsQ
MKSITVFNNKGGVGKTTFLCNLASYTALRLSKRVLIIDADPQCNATIYMLTEEETLQLYEGNGHDTIDSFLEPLRRGKGYGKNSAQVMRSERFGMDLIPGDPRLALSEDLLASDWLSGMSGDPRGLQTTFAFKEMMLRYSNYDYIFVDVGPSLGAINRAILVASDYFVVPMSSDIFSLMAIKNISLSLTKWKRALEKGLAAYEAEEGVPYDIDGQYVKWALSFAGYVTQQYAAKTVDGQRRPVKAYEKIIRRIPRLIRSELIDKFSSLPSGAKHKLGEIPNLYSVVPMSQTANAPIFELKARDGVVGAHFAKVIEAGDIYSRIATTLLDNVEAER